MKSLSEWLRGPVRHMIRIGQHPSHMELRERNEARLAALKAERRLTENKEKHERTITAGGCGAGITSNFGPEFHNADANRLVNGQRASDQQRSQDVGVRSGRGWKDSPVRYDAAADSFYLVGERPVVSQRGESD